MTNLHSGCQFCSHFGDEVTKILNRLNNSPYFSELCLDKLSVLSSLHCMDALPLRMCVCSQGQPPVCPPGPAHPHVHLLMETKLPANEPREREGQQGRGRRVHLRTFSEKNGFSYFGTLTCYREVNHGWQVGWCLLWRGPSKFGILCRCGNPNKN